MRVEAFEPEVQRYARYCAVAVLERYKRCICKDNVETLAWRLYAVVEMFEPELNLGIGLALESIASHLSVYLWRMDVELVDPCHTQDRGHEQLNTQAKLDAHYGKH